LSDDQVLISVEGVSKKFCRSLRRSLWFGVTDLAREVVGMRRSLSLRSGEFLALQDVSLAVRRGECVGLIGANGAGKSTLLKLLNGLIRPDAGHIRMRGRVGALIELGAGFSPILTGRENIYVNAAVLGLSKREVEPVFDEIVEFSQLGEFIDAPLQSYSSGMRVRLGFSVAAQLRPDVLLVDEVLAVGDLAFRLKALNRIRSLIEGGTSIFFVSHDTGQVLNVCNRAIWLDRGVVVSDGAATEVVREYERSQLSARGGPGEVGLLLDPEAGLAISRIRVAPDEDPMGATLAPGDPLELLAYLEIAKVTKDIVFTFGFRSASQELLYGERVSLQDAIGSPGSYVLRLRVPPGRLMPGTHLISCGLALGSDFGEYAHYIHESALVSVEGGDPTAKVGYFELNPEIHVERTG